MVNKLLLKATAALLTSLCVLSSAAVSAEEIKTDPLPEAFAEFMATLGRVEAQMRQSPAYGSEQERVAAYQHLLRMLIPTVEAEVIQNADFPYFRVNDFWVREGGDSPDQRYSIAPIRGGEAYRLWGKLGSAKRIEVQLNVGRPWFGEGPSVGYLPFENIEFEEDGSFEIWLTPKKHLGNWLLNPTEADNVFVRQIYDRWDDRDTGEVHIDRAGHEGDAYIAKTELELAAQMRNATKTLEQFTLGWEKFVFEGYVKGVGKNRISPLADTYKFGGVKGRWMSTGHYDLLPGESLLIKAPKTSASHVGLQLTDMWFASLEYANRTSSLNASQSILSPDGSYYYVISDTDPGHANWLDTGGINRGTILMRYDGALGDIPQSLYPVMELVNSTEIREHIPGFRRVSEAERAVARAARREHLQLRSAR